MPPKMPVEILYYGFRGSLPLVISLISLNEMNSVRNSLFLDTLVLFFPFIRLSSHISIVLLPEPLYIVSLLFPFKCPSQQPRKVGKAAKYVSMLSLQSLPHCGYGHDMPCVLGSPELLIFLINVQYFHL